MSSGAKQHYKQFNINSIQDACVVLGSLISGAIIHYEKYKEYSDEADALLKCSDEEFITAKKYDDINDKLLYRQHEILKLFADHQSSSFSYVDLRKLLEKKNYLSSSLSDDILEILSELLHVRNWTFHNPQSLMIAAKEASEKNIPKELKGMVEIIPQLNPILIPKVQQYELLMLASLTVHTKKRITQFDKIIQSMKADYQEMYSSIENKPFMITPHGIYDKVQYVERCFTSQLTGYQSDIAQISMAIQKTKYDGTEQAFKNCILRASETTSNTD